MTINDNVSFDKIPSTDINGRCIPPVFSANQLKKTTYCYYDVVTMVTSAHMLTRYNVD